MLSRGTIVLIGLDPTLGHEQQGGRPCVVVSDPSASADQKYTLIAVVPMTSSLGSGALYPSLARSRGGLSKASCALVDKLRSVDKRRVVRVYGRIQATELAAIDLGLRYFLGLTDD